MPHNKTSSKLLRQGGFPARYGSWALVAGASQGLGAAYARALASRGMNLVLAARRRELLDRLAEELRRQHGVKVRCFDGDLASGGFTDSLRVEISDLDLGLLVYNAAHAPVGDFDAASGADLSRVVDVNVRGPVTLLHMILPAMVARKRGAIVLMSSLAGDQGSPRIATYAASKAFNRILAEGLWRELKGKGIDVVACCAGAIRTPGYAAAAGKDAPGTLDPSIVAERALRRLGRGPLAIPGFVNKAAHGVMSRLLSRRAAIGIMAGSTSNLTPAKETTP